MKVQLPWMGKATGSSAGLIYQSYWGRTFARTFPAMFHYPNTPAQQACQTKYWHNRIEAEACYGTIQRYLSSYQKRITNPYNAMFKSVNDMFIQHETNPYAPIPNDFGIDIRHSVNANIRSVFNVVRPDRVIIDANIINIKSEFQFEPDKAFLILVNFRRKEVWTQPANFHGGNIYGSWPNTTTWPSTQVAIFYVGLANNHFCTNFFLLENQ